MKSTTAISEAHNLSALSCAVNERTGGVDVSVSLGRISCGLQDPATFELMLHSSPGSSGNNPHGFGGNWTINSPRIDKKNKTIYFGDAKSARYTDNFKLEYRRLKDIRIDEQPNADGVIIFYKNGTVEYYNHRGEITHLVSACGHALNFTYERSDAETDQVLSKVDDGYGNELSIDYGVTSLASGQRVVTVTQRIAGETSTTNVYIQRDGQFDIVESISLPNNHTQRFHFEYYKKEEGRAHLSKVTKPNGQAQRFTYQSINYNNTQTINVVSKLETMGNDLAQSNKAVVTYEYSDQNFTGYPLIKTQVPGRDNCIYRDDDFTYSVTEVHDDIKIKRTFNRFHLIIDEVVTCIADNAKHSSTSFIYPIVKNQDINGQPADFSLWSRRSTAFHDSTNRRREIYEARSFDTFGNLLFHRDLSGLTTTNVYYPANSTQEEGCPPTQDAYFICHLKRSEIKPELARGPLKTLELKYKKILGLSYISPIQSTPPTTIRPFMVRAVESKANGLLLSTADYLSATADTPNDARLFVGMQQWEQHPSDSSPYSITHTYSKVGALAKVITVHRSNDKNGPLEKSTSKTFSVASGLTYKEEDFNGAITEYQFDAENRLIKKTTFAQTPSAQEERYTYKYYKDLGAPYGYQNVAVTTKPNGMQYSSYINFNNQLSFALEALPQGENYCTKKLQYFASGLIASETEYDTVLNPSGAQITVDNTTRYTYHARELSRIRHFDETSTIITHNKVLNTTEHQQHNGAVYRNTYDNAGNVTSITIITEHDTDEVATVIEQTTYDGYGRKVAHVNRTGGRSSFEYDHFDRLIKETVYDTDSNGRVDSNTFTYDRAIQNMSLPVSVISTTTHAGQQEIILEWRRAHDGFGRIIQQDNQTFSYAQPFYNEPSGTSIFDVAKTATTFDPVTLLTNDITKTLNNAPETFTQYRYDKQTGAIIEAQSFRSGIETANIQFSYNPKGGLTKAHGTYGKRVSVTTEKTFSASGARVMTATNHLGKQQSYHYDHCGRLWVKKYKDLDILIGATYDQYGNIIRLKVQSPKFSGAHEEFVILSFEYDAFNFVSRRCLRVRKNENMHVILDARTTYGDNELITSRQLSKDEKATDNLEQVFTYQGAYGHLRSSTTTQSTMTPLVTNYNFAGGQRFSTIETSGKPPQVYNYHRDQVASLEEGTTFKNFNSDFLGNLTNGPESGTDARFFNYDASNSLTSCDVYNERKMYEYVYGPFGKLSQIIRGSENITYAYDGDVVIGEVSDNTKTLYLSFGNIVLGRYLVRGEREELEIFGTDSAGTVRCVTTCLPGGDMTQPQYHDYTDFGERRNW